MSSERSNVELELPRRLSAAKGSWPPPRLPGCSPAMISVSEPRALPAGNGAALELAVLHKIDDRFPARRRESRRTRPVQPAAARLFSFGSSPRKVTFTPMSGKIRGSSLMNEMRTFTVAFWRSAVGITVRTFDWNLPVWICVEYRSHGLIGYHARDVRFVHIDFNFVRIHVHQCRDAGARESAARRNRRHHFANLRIFRHDNSIERRADHGVVHACCASCDART